jgi:predicted nucleic acid-binding protein
MKYLLDTNVISEMQKSNCNPQVKSFFDTLPFDDLFLCIISIGEIGYGIEKLPPGKKKHELSLWLYTQVVEWFKERIISLDMNIALEWGKIRGRSNRTLQLADSLIAAVAISHHMTLVTRNAKDFEDIAGLELINPWEL